MGELSELRPTAPLRVIDDKPAWQQIIDLFERFGLDAPPVRLRDELVNHLAWAKYGNILDAPRTEGRGEGQPVAWAYEYTNHLKGDRAPGGWLRAVAFEAPTRARVNAGFARNVQPLYASPIREPEISREAVIEAIRQHVRTRYERREHHGAYHFSGLEAAADAILNLAQHQGGGRG